MLSIFLIVIFVLGTIIGAYGSVYLKLGAKDFNLNLIKQLRNKNIILGLFLFAFSTILYVLLLKTERLSLLYPLTSLGYIWVSLLSVALLKEKMSIYKWMGIACIIAGIFLINYFG
jgi:drug/metabolite transporter (DMT)-like permease